jgi:hypothetical protein
MYFTSSSREDGILTSPYMVTTSGGCLYFYYNMEGGPSVELKIYIQAGVYQSHTNLNIKQITQIVLCKMQMYESPLTLHL